MKTQSLFDLLNAVFDLRIVFNTVLRMGDAPMTIGANGRHVARMIAPTICQCNDVVNF
jgi:hypothetical protein